jgi:hypothetical protein
VRGDGRAADRHALRSLLKLLGFQLQD